MGSKLTTVTMLHAETFPGCGQGPTAVSEEMKAYTQSQ